MIVKREVSGFKKARSKRFEPLNTSRFSMMKKVISLLDFGQNLGGHWLGPV
jgi:hypothetical protein